MERPPPPRPIRKIGPLFDSTRFKDAKDPCICFDGRTWHIYGSGGRVDIEEWHILHATAPNIDGPWTEQEPATLRGLTGPHVAAPSVVYDPEDKLFHMAVQKDFMAIGGDVTYLVSADGHTFTKMRTLVRPSGEREAGLYDPQLCSLGEKKYLVYSGIPKRVVSDVPIIPQPDIFLARSVSGHWYGPWRRLGKILDHDDVTWHHNRREHPDYEWGLEGPQIVELPNGDVLLNATSFIEEGRRGTRQRVFFAIAKKPEGPYSSIGPMLPEREEEWESGENGHASVWVKDGLVYLFYQARSQTHPEPKDNNWRYGIAVFNAEDLKAPELPEHP